VVGEFVEVIHEHDEEKLEDVIAQGVSIPTTVRLRVAMLCQNKTECRANGSTHYAFHHRDDLIANFLWGRELRVGLVPPFFKGHIRFPVVEVEHWS